MKAWLNNKIVVCALWSVLFSLFLTFSALAQPYHPFYWVTGSVHAPEGVSTADRRVVLFEQPLANGWVNGPYASGIVGPAGPLGQANQYIINAFDNSDLPVVAGRRYFVASPNDNPVNPAAGYGADPVEFILNGLNGYDTVLALNLTLGGGPFARDDGGGRTGVAPYINNGKFGNRLYQPLLVARGQEFIVSSRPKMAARISSRSGVNSSSIAMVLNEGTASSKTYTIRAANVTQAAGPTEAPTDINFVFDYAAENESLPDGPQNITLRASNDFGLTFEVYKVTVAGGEPRLIGVPVVYPSPLHLKSDKEVVFQYTLSQDMAIELNILNVAGRTVLRRRFTAGSEGGSAGVNKVTWNLITNREQLVSTGILVFTLTRTDNNQLLGKGKLTALGN